MGFRLCLGLQPRVHRLRIEGLGVELRSDPVQQFLVLWVVRVGDGLKQAGIARRATAVLRRACALAGHAAGIGDAGSA
jgi:hypothetical protein